MKVDRKKNSWSGFAGSDGIETADLTGIADDELTRLAQQWRLEALRGVREARGKAHRYETELRRRGAKVIDVVEVDALDTRSLAARTEPPPWWRFW